MTNRHEWNLANSIFPAKSQVFTIILFGVVHFSNFLIAFFITRQKNPMDNDEPSSCYAITSLFLSIKALDKC